MSNFFNAVNQIAVDSVVGLANILGLGEVVSKTFKRIHTGGKDISETEAMKALNEAINMATNLSGKQLDEFEQKLNSLPFGVPYTLKNSISKKRREIKDTINKLKVDKAKSDHYINKAARLASDIEDLSAGDLTTGKGDQYLQEAKEALKQATQNNKFLKENIDYEKIENRL